MAASAQPSPLSVRTDRPAASTIQWLSRALFGLLLLLALAAPLSTHGAVLAFRLALVVWIVKLILQRRQLQPQALALPLLAYLACSAVSTLLSYDPLLSWGRMRAVGLVLLAVLTAQSLASLRQIKWIMALLLASSLLTVAWTAWQFTAGVGVRLTRSNPALVRLGIHGGDIVASANGISVRSPVQWERVVSALPRSAPLELVTLHGIPMQKLVVHTTRALLEPNQLYKAGAVQRGRPERAEGFFHSYVPYSELLMEVGLLAWGMLIAGGTRSRRTQLLPALAFAAIALALAFTLTRASLAFLLLGCLAAVWTTGKRKARILSLAALLLAVVALSLWIQRERGLGWIALRDAGTQYRLLMWRDGLRMIPQHPLLGVGMDSIVGLPNRWNLEAYRRFPDFHSHFHSTPIQLAVEGGLLTLAAWLWLMVAYFLVLLRLVRRTGQNHSSAYGISLGLFAAFVGFAATSLVHYIAGDAEVMIVFWLLMGMTLAMDKSLACAGAMKPAQ